MNKCVLIGWIKSSEITRIQSHFSIRRNYMKLVQSSKLPFPNFVMLFGWRSTPTRREKWRKFSNPSEEKSLTFFCHLASIDFRFKRTSLSIIGTNNSKHAILNVLTSLVRGPCFGEHQKNIAWHLTFHNKNESMERIDYVIFC